MRKRPSTFSVDKTEPKPWRAIGQGCTPPSVVAIDEELARLRDKEEEPAEPHYHDGDQAVRLAPGHRMTRIPLDPHGYR